MPRRPQDADVIVLITLLHVGRMAHEGKILRKEGPSEPLVLVVGNCRFPQHGENLYHPVEL